MLILLSFLVSVLLVRLCKGCDWPQSTQHFASVFSQERPLYLSALACRSSESQATRATVSLDLSSFLPMYPTSLPAYTFPNRAGTRWPPMLVPFSSPLETPTSPIPSVSPRFLLETAGLLRLPIMASILWLLLSAAPLSLASSTQSFQESTARLS